jgi:hypothetical protein
MDINTQLSSGEQLAEADEWSQIFDLANSILEECEEAASLSDLNTVIYLFREVLDRYYPVPHPFRSESLRDLGGSLLTRFSITSQRQDLDQAISFYCERWNEWNEGAMEPGQQSHVGTGPSQFQHLNLQCHRKLHLLKMIPCLKLTGMTQRQLK